jgi:hypothetical protein
MPRTVALALFLWFATTTVLAQSRLDAKWRTDRPANPLTITGAPQKQSVELEVSVGGAMQREWNRVVRCRASREMGQPVMMEPNIVLRLSRWATHYSQVWAIHIHCLGLYRAIRFYAIEKAG